MTSSGLAVMLSYYSILYMVPDCNEAEETPQYLSLWFWSCVKCYFPRAGIFVGFCLWIIGYFLLGYDEMLFYNGNGPWNAKDHFTYLTNIQYGLISVGGGMAYWSCYIYFVMHSNNKFNFYLWFGMPYHCMLLQAYPLIIILTQSDGFILSYYALFSYIVPVFIIMLCYMIYWWIVPCCDKKAYDEEQKMMTMWKEVEKKCRQEEETKKGRMNQENNLNNSSCTNQGILFMILMPLASIGTQFVLIGVLFHFILFAQDANYIAQDGNEINILVEYYMIFLGGTVVGSWMSWFLNLLRNKQIEWNYEYEMQMAFTKPGQPTQDDDSQRKLVLRPSQNAEILSNALSLIFFCLTPVFLGLLYDIYTNDLLVHHAISNPVGLGAISFFLGHGIVVNNLDIKLNIMLKSSFITGRYSETQIVKSRACVISIVDLMSTMFVPWTFQYFNTNPTWGMDYGSIFIKLTWISTATCVIVCLGFIAGTKCFEETSNVVYATQDSAKQTINNLTVKLREAVTTTTRVNPSGMETTGQPPPKSKGHTIMSRIFTGSKKQKEET